MKVLRTAAELTWPVTRVGFVPTMGAFHEGHLTLMRKAKAEVGYCVVSLFVNPTQFGKGEDFTKYPRDEHRDFEMARAAGVDAVFAPSAEEVYGDSKTLVQVSGVSDLWEGPIRPGHFDGVATVVAKLFGMVGPCEAYFGQKDFQQCCVIQRMVLDLHLPVRLHFEDTIRESDGLAMSSRNVYLSPEDRKIAPLIYANLIAAKNAINAGEPIDNAIQNSLNILREAGFEVQYFAAVDQFMNPLDSLAPGSRLITAVRIGGVRLIDNIALA